MILKKIAAIVTVAMLATAVLLSGCTAATPSPTVAPTTAATVAPTEAPTQAPTTAPATAAPVTGSIVAVGSTALQPLAQKGADMFTAANPGAAIQVQGGGSGTGLSQVAAGSCDIGDSDLFAADKLDAATAGTISDHQVCVVGFAAVVNSDVTVTNLTQQQLIDVFTGKVTNWKDVGGGDEKIVIINRPASSGTRYTFKKYALNGSEEATGVALTEDSSGTVRQTVASTPGAISYLAFPYLDSTVKALQFNGVDPTAANVESGSYPIWSYEHMYTKGEATGLAKAFLDYMVSPGFAPQITALSYIPIGDMKVTRDYAPTPVTGSIVVVGSTALQPLAQKGADMFTAANPGAAIQVQGGGSGTGLTQVSQKACDIGDSDLYAADKLTADQAKPLVDHQVCVVGFAAVVNPKVNVTNLTSQQLIDIFTGKITNWKDVGGADQKIVIINRPASSGTRFTFKKYALNGSEEATGVALTEDSSGTVRQTVASTDGAISYLAFSYLDGSVKPLQYNGVDPTAANVESGAYPIWSYEHMYTNGDATGLAKAFIGYMTGSDFASQITALSYIPIGDMKVKR